MGWIPLWPWCLEHEQSLKNVGAETTLKLFALLWFNWVAANCCKKGSEKLRKKDDFHIYWSAQASLAGLRRKDVVRSI